MNRTVIDLEESSELLITYGLGNTSFANGTGNSNHGHQYQFYMVSLYLFCFLQCIMMTALIIVMNQYIL